MNRYRDLLRHLLAAVEVVSPSSFTWFGARSPGLAPELEAAMGAGSVREYLLHNLKWRLYADFYCAGSVRPPLNEPESEALTGNSAFVRALSEANAGVGGREPGWLIVRGDGERLVVARDGLSLWMTPDEVYPVDRSDLSPGSRVGILMPKELLRLSPGFYMALGNAEFPLDGSVPILRFYWNLRSEGAAWLIRALTTGLNDRRLAFRLKVVNEPGRYSRCDAGVLYTRQADYEQVARVVGQVHKTLAPALNGSTPALTKAVAPGLGLAEDPGIGSVSFGMSRCQLLAEAMVRCAELGRRDPEERMRAIEDRFAEAGLTLDRPYLNAGVDDHYRFASG
jgi:HopA1 effector protein family